MTPPAILTAEPVTAEPPFRLDRGVSIHLIRPLTQILNGRQSRIPILMYHGIRPGIGTGHPYFETATAPAVFEEHMRFLAERGYRTLTLADVIAFIATGGTNQKCV